MWFFFLLHLMFDGVVGVVVWLAYRKLTTHMRDNPDAAKLVAEHVIAPLMTGKVEKPEVKRTKGTLV